MQYDDIIVGAGSSGAVLASRLSEDPARSVLLLEAGPDFATLEQTPADLRDGRAQSVVAHDWGFKALAIGDREIDYPRGKVTGGSSAVNSAVALRGVPADYDEWATMGNSEWSWSNVLPFFRKLESDRDYSGDFHGQDGPVPVKRPQRADLLPVQAGFLDACKAAGIPECSDFNDPESTGVAPWPRNIIDGVRISTAIAYLGQSRHRLNLTIRSGCLVRRVLIENGKAVGVELESGGEVQTVYGKRITLSAGAVISPAILLRSGIGPAAQLAAFDIAQVAELPVGETLIDHCLFPILCIPKEGVTDLDAAWQIQAGVRYTASGSSEFNDMQIYALSNMDFTDYPDYQALLGAQFAVGVAPGLQRPNSRGKVSLRSFDANVQPNITLDFTEDAEDMRRLVDGLRVAWKIVQQPVFQQFIERTAILTDEMVESDEACSEYIKATVNTIYHPTATCRMGPDGDPGAVVDQYCRVRGIEGLRVVDASVIPSIPRANTNLTCIMIGEKVADWMKAE